MPKINKQSCSDLWNNIEQTYLCVIIVSKTEEKEGMQEKFEERMVFFFPFNFM